MRQVREVLRFTTAGVGLNEIARRVGVAAPRRAADAPRLASSSLIVARIMTATPMANNCQSHCASVGRVKIAVSVTANPRSTSVKYCQ